AGGGRGARGRGAARDVAPARNGLRVEIRYSSADASTEVALGNGWCVKPSDELIGALSEAFGRGAAEISY
ncbi:MAG: hypothetical protein ACRYHA_26285, partial [Janthinobacterium lividum]